MPHRMGHIQGATAKWAGERISKKVDNTLEHIVYYYHEDKTMITTATVLVDGEPMVEITSQFLLGLPDSNDVDATGYGLDFVRGMLQECWQQVFPDNEVDIVFPEVESV